VEEVLLKLKALFDDEVLNEDDKLLVNWFIINVLPTVHVASWAKNNWQLYAYESGAPPLYSNYITSSDEAFALFLIKHYRVPPPLKEIKVEKSSKGQKKKKIEAEKDDDKMEESKEDNDNDNKDNEDETEKQGEEEDHDDENDNGDLKNNKRKQKYKKVDIKQGEKDYQKWMSQLKAIQSKHGKEAIVGMDKKICSLIIFYRNKLMEEGFDVMADAAQQEIIDVQDSDDKKEYIDLDTVGQSTGG